jgi:polyphosphate kinase
MMKQRLIELIEAEAERALRGEPASIQAKMNSLNDKEIMRALEKASQAGVRINLNIRGICCWTPDTPQGQVRTRIISIVDRYLEHARIFSFGNGGSPLVYIASADWMTRNTLRRVEVAAPILDARAKQRLEEIFDVTWRDNVQAREQKPNGRYIRRYPGAQEPLSSQNVLYDEACRKAK